VESSSKKVVATWQRKNGEDFEKNDYKITYWSGKNWKGRF